METSKNTISLVWIGHVDHGKSTTLGHLLYQIGAIDPRLMEKLNEESVQNQMESWKWAYVLDSLPEEKTRGITSDIAFFPFETEKRKFMLIDAPGHRDFVKNMIRGAAQADACVLVVSAVPNDLKSGLKIGGYQDPGGQTREHAVLASVLGIKKIIIAINKMDLVDYSKEKYENAITLITELLQDIQSPWISDIKSIPFIPISGFMGENLSKSSDQMPWYSGPSLIDALNNLQGINTSEDQMSMRFLTYDLDERHGFGTLIMGKTLGRPISIGESVVLLPIGLSSEVKEIWIQDEKVPELTPGDHGSILLKNIDKNDLEEGIVLAPGDLNYQFPNIVRARLLVLEGSIVPGSTIVLHCGTSYVTSQIKEIRKLLRINPKYKKIPREFEGKTTIAFENELIEIDIQLDSAIVVEKYKDFPELGRIILRHTGQTIAVGIVNELLIEE